MHIYLHNVFSDHAYVSLSSVRERRLLHSSLLLQTCTFSKLRLVNRKPNLDFVRPPLVLLWLVTAPAAQKTSASESSLEFIDSLGRDRHSVWAILGSEHMQLTCFTSHDCKHAIQVCRRVMRKQGSFVFLNTSKKDTFRKAAKSCFATLPSNLMTIDTDSFLQCARPLSPRKSASKLMTTDTDSFLQCARP